MSDTDRFEYRVFGCTAHGWRVTDWSDRDRAEHVYRECDWAALSFERRVAGDDSTIERKAKPSEGEWMEVTDDMVRPKDEKGVSA